MKKSILIGISLVFQLQHGHGIKLVDKRSVGVHMAQEFNEITGRSMSVLRGLADFLGEARVEPDDVVGVSGSEGGEVDEYASELMAQGLMHMRSTKVKNTLDASNEFQTLPDIQQHELHKSADDTRRLVEIPEVARFATEGVPRLVTSIKEDAPFMASFKHMVERLPQPADQTVDAAAPVLREMAKAAPRLAKYMMPKMAAVLGPLHTALLQGVEKEGFFSKVRKCGENITAASMKVNANVQTKDSAEMEGEGSDRTKLGWRGAYYVRLQSGINFPILLNPGCTDDCVLFELSLTQVKLMMIGTVKRRDEMYASYLDKFDKGPSFIFFAGGMIAKTSKGGYKVRYFTPILHAITNYVNLCLANKWANFSNPRKPAFSQRKHFPINEDVGRKPHHLRSPGAQLWIGRKYGWDVTFSASTPPGEPMDALTAFKRFGGYNIGVTPSRRVNLCEITDTTFVKWRGFALVEPMALHFKFSFLGDSIHVPFLRVGISQEGSGDQIFFIARLAKKIGGNKTPSASYTVGNLWNWLVKPLLNPKCPPQLAWLWRWTRPGVFFNKEDKTDSFFNREDKPDSSTKYAVADSSRTTKDEDTVKVEDIDIDMAAGSSRTTEDKVEMGTI